MGLGALRTLAMGQIFDALSVPVTITPPSGAAVTTTGVWSKPLEETMPYGEDYARRDPRKVLAIRRTSTLDVIPRGSVIVAAETDGGDALTWRVDGLDGLTSHDLIRVVVVRA
jgi:hypothetical protein